MFRKLWNKMFGPFWYEMFLFEVKLFWSLWDKLFPLLLKWLSECNWSKFGLWDVLKSGFKLPFSTRNSSERETTEILANSCKSKERQPLQEKGAGPEGRALTDWMGRRSSWVCFSCRGWDGRASLSKTGSNMLPLMSILLGLFCPGQVVFSVSLCFIGTTPATQVELSQFYGWAVVSRGWSVCFLGNRCLSHFSWICRVAGFILSSL